MKRLILKSVILFTTVHALVGNEKEIAVGTTLDLSKTLKAESMSTKEGLHKAFEKINRDGTLKNIRLKLIALDDEYDPTKARKNVESLMNKHNVEFIVSPMGATPLEGFLDLAKEKKIVIAFPSTGDPSLRDQNIINMIHFRPSYANIDVALLDHATQKLGVKKFAFFYPTDESAVGIQEHIKAAGIPSEQYISATYEPNTTDFKKQAEEIKKFNPDAIALFSTSRGATELIRQIGVPNLVGKSLLGVELGDQLFHDFLKEQGLSKQFVDTQNLPNPATSTLEIVEEYRKEMGNKPLDIFSLEAFISGMVFAEILKRIEGDITKENFIKTAENIKDFNFKGLKLNFDPATRQLSSQIWLNTGEKDWLAINVQELKKAAAAPATPEPAVPQQPERSPEQAPSAPTPSTPEEPANLGIKR